MIRGLNLILFATSVMLLAGVYWLKYDSADIAEQKAELIREIEQQENRLSLLQADWAYLTQPSHVAPILERHAEVLMLTRLDAEQFGSIEDIPMRPEILDDEGLTALLEALDAGHDPIGDKLAELLSQ